MKTTLCWLKNLGIKAKGGIQRLFAYVSFAITKSMKIIFMGCDRMIVRIGSKWNAYVLYGRRLLDNPEGLQSRGARRYRAYEFYASPKDIDLGYYDIIFNYTAYGVKYYVTRRRYEKL